jgi:hypothetical protein
MKHNRLEGVLNRNRKHVVLDLALAAFFLMALLFSGLAFGSEIPKLSVASTSPIYRAASGVDDASVAVVPAAESSRGLAYH